MTQTECGKGKEEDGDKEEAYRFGFCRDSIYNARALCESYLLDMKARYRGAVYMTAYKYQHYMFVRLFTVLPSNCQK